MFGGPEFSTSNVQTSNLSRSRRPPLRHIRGLTPPHAAGQLPAMSLAWRLSAVPLLIGLNAFFVAAEYAVVAVRPAEIESLRKRGKGRTATAIARLKADPASAIGTIQVCITMTNLLLGWIGEPGMSAVLDRVFGPLIRRWSGFEVVSTALSFI